MWGGTNILASYRNTPLKPLRLYQFNPLSCDYKFWCLVSPVCTLTCPVGGGYWVSNIM